jgi:hypothetical protein
MPASVITTVATALRAFFGPVEVIGRRVVVAGPRDCVIEVELLTGVLRLVVRGHGTSAGRRLDIGPTRDGEALAAVVVWVVGELVEASAAEGPTLH